MAVQTEASASQTNQSGEVYLKHRSSRSHYKMRTASCERERASKRAMVYVIY
ncbi:UNVERIFIED_CONTAM: hypothetical protein FKN15_025465 [Acipenser sinensis]